MNLSRYLKGVIVLGSGVALSFLSGCISLSGIAYSREEVPQIQTPEYREAIYDTARDMDLTLKEGIKTYSSQDMQQLTDVFFLYVATENYKDAQRVANEVLKHNAMRGLELYAILDSYAYNSVAHSAKR